MLIDWMEVEKKTERNIERVEHEDESQNGLERRFSRLT